MSVIYIVRVFEGEGIYEYEFGNKGHAQEFSKQEREYNEIWAYDTVDDKERLLSIHE